MKQVDEKRDIREVMLSRHDDDTNELAVLINNCGICKINYKDDIKREDFSKLLITLADHVTNWNPENKENNNG